MNNILGCYVSVTHGGWNDSPQAKDVLIEQGKLFRTYIWGETGISEQLKLLINSNYGNDLSLILLQFYVNPIPLQTENLKEIGTYSKKEKSIAIPVIINQNNFFNLSEENRHTFLKDAILDKMEVLRSVVTKKKFDTNIDLLKQDVARILLVEPPTI